MNKVDETLPLIHKALGSQNGDVPLSILLKGQSLPDMKLKPVSFDSEKAKSLIEGMGIRTSILEDLAVGTVSTSKLTQYVSIELTVSEIKLLLDANDKLGAAAVSLDYPIYPSLSESVGIVGAPTLWEEGYTGSGIRVGVLDTGVDPSNSFLNLQETVSFIEGETETDVIGHGTHVAGIIGGSSDSEFRGMASDCELLSCKVLGTRGGTEMTIARGVQWCVDNDAKILNLSLGGPGSKFSPMIDALRAATDLGVVCVVAAGNEGFKWGTISSPGCAEFVITVGAVDKQLKIPYYTSRGPVFDMQIKPDLVAPGGGVNDALCPYEEGIISFLSSHANPNPVCVVKQNYVKMSGTSMATPHTAGAIAILLQAIEELGVSPGNLKLPTYVKHALMASAKALKVDTCTQGAGLLNLSGALSLIRDGNVPETVTLPPTKAPTANYGCGGNRELSSGKVKALAKIQKKFVLPVSPLCSSLIAAAGKGSAEAHKALQGLVMESVLNLAVRDIERATRSLPDRYLDPEIRAAIREYLVEDIKTREGSKERERLLA